MAAKKVKVEKCQEYSHFEDSLTTIKGTCTKGRRREVPDKRTIPEWCPLENY